MQGAIFSEKPVNTSQTLISKEKIEILQQRRLERENNASSIDQSKVEKMLKDYRKQLGCVMEEKKKIENELSRIKLEHEEEVVSLQLQIEEIALDKELIEEQANMFREQLGVVLNESEHNFGGLKIDTVSQKNSDQDFVNASSQLVEKTERLSEVC